MVTAISTRAATGILGLDDILGGGFTKNRLYLLEGTPGAGKTTLAFQFLIEGARKGEAVIYVTLSETQEEITAVAASHGWSLDGIEIHELIPVEESLDPSQHYTVFHPSEVELSDVTQPLLKEVERLRPTRLVIDSLSELRLLAGSPLRYRRQILALKRFFSRKNCTVLMLDDLTSRDHDLQVQSIAHGAILLEHINPGFGAPRRRLSVTKFRGSEYRAGYHDCNILHGGLKVYPRLIASEHRERHNRARLKSGLDGLDSLIGGGLECGTSTLIQGAAGTGKSTISMLFAVEAAKRGEHVVVVIFDESIETLLSRMDGFHVPLREYVQNGHIEVRQVDPAELSPGELVNHIRQASSHDRSTMVIVDSLNGYLNSMPDEKFLIIQLHELLAYLGQKGVATILVSAQQGLISSAMMAPVDASYLADTVMLLRYFEAEGEVKQAISVIKMRGGDHERTIRQLTMKQGKIYVGEPLRNYRGIFTGVPQKIEKL